VAGYPVKLPYDVILYYRPVRAELDRGNTDIDSIHEITGAPIPAIRGQMLSRFGVRELDGDGPPRNDDDWDDTQKNMIPCEYADTSEAAMESSDLEQINRLCRGITPREKEILFRKYGIGYDHEHIYHEIHEIMGISRQGAQQSAACSLVKARAKARSDDRCKVWRDVVIDAGVGVKQVAARKHRAASKALAGGDRVAWEYYKAGAK